MSVKSPKHLEDLRVGDRFEVGCIVVEAEEMIGYARAFDPQPIHLDDDAARAAGFSGVIASGWFTTSIAMRLFVARDPFNGTRILGFGADKIRWPTPTYVADRLNGTLQILEILPPREGKDFGFVRLAYVLRNQHDATTLQMEPLLAVPISI